MQKYSNNALTAELRGRWSLATIAHGELPELGAGACTGLAVERICLSYLATIWTTIEGLTVAASRLAPRASSIFI